MQTTLTASTPYEVILEVADHYDREYGRLSRLASMTTGLEKKLLLAKASYAASQDTFWRTVEIETGEAR